MNSTENQHTEYKHKVTPKFEIFDNRLEITSYGSLPPGLSQDEFFQGFSILRNKELMRIFKDLDLVEQLGSGIPRILKAYDKECFHFSENFLRVVLPSNELINQPKTEQVTEQVTEQATEHVTEHVTEQVTEQVRTLISVMKEGKYSRNELMEAVNIKHRPTFLYNYLQPAIQVGFIELTIPDKPTSSKQQYFLTQKGRNFINSEAK